MRVCCRANARDLNSKRSWERKCNTVRGIGQDRWYFFRHWVVLLMLFVHNRFNQQWGMGWVDWESAVWHHKNGKEQTTSKIARTKRERNKSQHVAAWSCKWMGPPRCHLKGQGLFLLHDGARPDSVWPATASINSTYSPGCRSNTSLVIWFNICE